LKERRECLKKGKLYRFKKEEGKEKNKGEKNNLERKCL
jgi:hypothetical protein